MCELSRNRLLLVGLGDGVAFLPLEFHFELLSADVITVEVLDGDLGTENVVVRHEA